jgi:hypothetical protein
MRIYDPNERPADRVFAIEGVVFPISGYYLSMVPIRYQIENPLS